MIYAGIKVDIYKIWESTLERRIKDVWIAVYKARSEYEKIQWTITIN